MAQAPRQTGHLVQDAARYLDRTYGYNIGRIPTVQYFSEDPWSAATSGPMGINIFADRMKRSLNQIGRGRAYDRVRDAWPIEVLMHELGHQVGPFDYGTPNSPARFLEEGLAEQFSADATPGYVRDMLRFPEPVVAALDSYIPNVNKVRRMSWNAARIADPSATQDYALADSDAAKLFRQRLLNLSLPGRKRVINRQLAKLKREKLRTGTLPDARVANVQTQLIPTPELGRVGVGFPNLSRRFKPPPLWVQPRRGPPYKPVAIKLRSIRPKKQKRVDPQPLRNREPF